MGGGGGDFYRIATGLPHTVDTQQLVMLDSRTVGSSEAPGPCRCVLYTFDSLIEAGSFWVHLSRSHVNQVQDVTV